LFLKYLIVGGFFLIPLGGIRAGDAVSPGFLEGHLKIVSPKPVEVAEAGAAKGATVDYAEYPLVILSREGQKEIVRVTADKDGNYRVALPPGDYVLDLCLGCQRSRTRTCARGTRAIQRCLEPDSPR